MRLMALKRLTNFLIAVTIKYIIRNSDISNLISHFTQELILELQCTKKGLQDMRNLIYFLYILIKLTFFREIPTLIKMTEYLRHLGDIGFVYFPFLKFFLVLSQLKRYLILVFFNNFYFLSKLTDFLDFLLRCLILTAHIQLH